MNKKVIYSIVMIVIIVGLAIAGTYAYLSATRTTSQNRFAAGTLDLSVADSAGQNQPFVIDNMGQNGNISGTKTWTIKNTGTLPGRLLLRTQGLENKDNGCNDQEASIEPACATNDEGELGNVINLKIKLGDEDKVSSTLATANVAAIGTAWSALDQIIMQPNEERTITAYWAAGEDSYGNEIQSDSVKFDLNFRLIQQISGAVAN